MGTYELEYSHRDKQRRETIEKLAGDDKPQVGVVDNVYNVYNVYTAIGMETDTTCIACLNYTTSVKWRTV